jgi:hypothetical protein
MKAYNHHRKLYKERIKPNFPLFSDEIPEYFEKNPKRFLLKVPIMPFLWWKIIFENQCDSKVEQSAHTVRKFFWLSIITLFGNLLLHFLGLYFNLFR